MKSKILEHFSAVRNFWKRVYPAVDFGVAPKARGFRQTPKFTAGFTLIELMVVIAIIGVLSSVVLSSLNSARAKARDSARQADLNQIRLAFELYRDNYGYYPLCGVSSYYCCSTGNCGTGTADWPLLGSQIQIYISALPSDPINTTSEYGYYYARGYRKIGSYKICSTGVASDYVLSARLESATGGLVRRCSDCTGSSCLQTLWGNSNLNYLLGN